MVNTLEREGREEEMEEKVKGIKRGRMHEEKRLSRKGFVAQIMNEKQFNPTQPQYK